MSDKTKASQAEALVQRRVPNMCTGASYRSDVERRRRGEECAYNVMRAMVIKFATKLDITHVWDGHTYH